MSRYNGSGWTVPLNVRTAKSYVGVDLASYNDRLYLVHADIDGTPYWSSLTGGIWSAATAFEGRNTATAPTLVVHQDRLWMIKNTTAGGIDFMSFDGTTWRREAGRSWATDCAASAASFAGKLYVAHRSYADARLHLGNHTDNTALQPSSTWRATAGSALTRHDEGLALVHRGGSRLRYAFAQQPTSWGRAGRCGSGSGCATASEQCGRVGPPFPPGPTSSCPSRRASRPGVLPLRSFEERTGGDRCRRRMGAGGYGRLGWRRPSPPPRRPGRGLDYCDVGKVGGPNATGSCQG